MPGDTVVPGWGKRLVPLVRDGGHTPARWARWQLRERAPQYVDENLGDATLSPATIAAVHAVSVRTLYSAIDRLGMRSSACIRDRRLARCYEELLLGAAPVAEIGARWGFSHPAHFSRAFQRRYGMPPSRVRSTSAVSGPG